MKPTKTHVTISASSELLLLLKSKIGSIDIINNPEIIFSKVECVTLKLLDSKLKIGLY